MQQVFRCRRIIFRKFCRFRPGKKNKTKLKEKRDFYKKRVENEVKMRFANETKCLVGECRRKLPKSTVSTFSSSRKRSDFQMSQIYLYRIPLCYLIHFNNFSFAFRLFFELFVKLVLNKERNHLLHTNLVEVFL